MTETTDDIVKATEHRAASGWLDPQALADSIIADLKERRAASGGTALDRSVLDKLDTRVAELDALAAERDHPKLKKGADTLRKAIEIVQQMLDLENQGAQEHLNGLAEKIRVCIRKSDNYAVTAGQHLRDARERCRAIGLDFNKWCAEADLGIKRRRIYQLIGPDPITAERRGKNHSSDTENVQSLHIEQLAHVEEPGADTPDQPAGQPLAITVERIATPAEAPALRHLPFHAALAQFKSWYSGLIPAEQLQVETAMGEVEAVSRTPIVVEEPAGAG